MKWMESKQNNLDNENVHFAKKIVQRNNGHGKHYF
jgi:hypothetical protein